MSSLNPLQQQQLSILMKVFALLTFIIIIRLVYLATAYADRRAQLRQQSCHDEEFIIPGCRGDIRAADGSIIVSSQARLNIEWNIPQGYVQAETDWYRLADNPILNKLLPPLEELESHLGETMPFPKAFDYHDEEAWNAVLAFYPSLIPHVSFKREVIQPSGLTPEVIGTTKTDPITGLEIGISGLEAQYDQKLRATSRHCQYLSHRQLFILQHQECDGQDVILPHAFTSGVN